MWYRVWFLLWSGGWMGGWEGEDYRVFNLVLRFVFVIVLGIFFFG